MDEPFAALDAQTRESLQDELLRIWQRTGKTIVFITHGIDEAVYLGQRVAVMTSAARPDQATSSTIDLDPARGARTCAPAPSSAALPAPRSGTCCTTRCRAHRARRREVAACRAATDQQPALRAPAAPDGLTADAPAAETSHERGRVGRVRPPRGCTCVGAVAAILRRRRSGRSPRGSGWSTRCSCRRSRTSLAALVGPGRRAGSCATHLQASLIRSLAGFGLAIAIAIPLGLLIGWYTPVADCSTRCWRSSATPPRWRCCRCSC